MITNTLRLHGKMDLRLDTFQLPECGDDAILAKVVCDSLCFSTLKALEQGTDHSRVPPSIAENPPIVGHEFSGRLLRVGKKWQSRFRTGDKFALQPDLKIPGKADTIGYSFPTVGGNATYVLIPSPVMEMGCLLVYTGDAYYKASLSEPLSCIIRACEAQYHVDKRTQRHIMDIVSCGRVAILGGAGPMGLALLMVLANREKRPKVIVVQDIDQSRLDRAKRIFTKKWASLSGIELHFLDGKMADSFEALMDIGKGEGFHDVFVLAPDPKLIETADKILNRDGCLNFFAGPASSHFTAPLNFYNIHYGGTHVVGTSGGNSGDMEKALKLMQEDMIDPSVMVTHVGGLESAREATLRLPKIGGGKKLIYPHLNIPLIAIDNFEEKGKNDPLFAGLDEICKKHGDLWNPEAESFLLRNAPRFGLI